ncbi:MAG: porin [Vicinamibacterales bacterium]
MASPSSRRSLCALIALAWFACVPPTAGAQTQPPARPAGPTDPSEGGGNSSLPPLHIGAVTLATSWWLDATRPGEAGPRAAADRFRLQRARVGAAGNLSGAIGWNLTGEFSGSPSLRNAFVVVRVADQLTVRVGQATPPTGLERGISPLTIETIDRTRLTNRLTYALEPSITAQNVRPYRRWVGYAVSLSTGNGFNRWDNNGGKDVAARLRLTPPRAPGLLLNAYGARGAQQDGTRDRYGLGVEYRRAPVHLAAEGLREVSDAAPARDGFWALAGYQLKPAAPRPYFQMLELEARYMVFNDPPSSRVVVVDADAGPATGALAPPVARELVAGGSYYLTGNLRFTANVIVPFDTRPVSASTIRTRLQFVF